MAIGVQADEGRLGVHMQVSIENVDKFERKLTVKFPAERLDRQVATRVAELGRTVRLNGFRPGKVPVAVIRQRFGAQVRDEILSELIGSTLREALTQEKLNPLAQPSVEVAPPAGDEIGYTASFEVLPEFPAIDVMALEIERPCAEIGDEDIDRMLETLRLQQTRFEEVDRAAQEKDFVLFDYAAEAGQTRFPAEGTERAGSVLGSGHAFKMLDEVLHGRKAGDAFEAEADFPADFHLAELAGKRAKLQLKIEKVQASILPELDAEFIRQFGVADGELATFREEVRANLQRELKAALMTRLKHEISEKLCAAYPLELPKRLVQAEARAMLSQGQPQVAQEIDPQQLESVLPQAEARIRSALLIGEIAREQKLEIDRSRLSEQLAAIASTYEDPEQVVEIYNKNPQLMAGLQNRVLEDQVAEWVAEHAKVQDLRLSFDEVMRPGA